MSWGISIKTNLNVFLFSDLEFIFRDRIPFQNWCKTLGCSKNWNKKSGQIITTSAEVTLNGALIRELPQNPLNSSLGIILICPEKSKCLKFPFPTQSSDWSQHVQQVTCPHAFQVTCIHVEVGLGAQKICKLPPRFFSWVWTEQKGVLGGGFKHFLFSPLPGEMIQFDEHIFQMGWFNHQLGFQHHPTVLQKRLLDHLSLKPRGFRVFGLATWGNENNRWAVTKGPLVDSCIEGIILPSYMGIVISQYKDPY